MKKTFFDKALFVLACACGMLAFCGAERTDGTLDALWFFGWLLAAGACAGISTLIERRRSNV